MFIRVIPEVLYTKPPGYLFLYCFIAKHKKYAPKILLIDTQTCARVPCHGINQSKPACGC